MYDSSVRFSGSLSPISSVFIAAFSLLSFAFSSISSFDKEQLSAGSTPSRVSGIPTRTVVFQEKPGSLFTGVFIVASLVIGSVAGTWLRSPAPFNRQGRLHRERSPTPPPDEEDVDNPTEEDGAAGDGDGGDNDPQEDGGADDLNGVVDGVGITAAAPAPEDPPPPLGGIEEDDDDDDLVTPDSSLYWFILFLVGNTLFGLIKRTWGTGGSRGSVVLCGLPTAEGSATIPGLLGQRPLPQPLSAEQIQVARALDPEVPTLIQHVADTASFYSVAPTPNKVHRIFVWRRAYILFGVLPSLGFLLAVLRLLLPLSANRNLVQINPVPPPAVVEQQEEVPAEEVDDPEPPPSPPTTPRRNRVPPAPHPSPISPRRQRPLAPLPFRDAATQAVCNAMRDFVRTRTAERTAREAKQGGDEGGMGERKERVRVVQRQVWKLMYELRRGDADDDEEAAVVDDDEDM
ncbi:hypothetical protein C8F04DRAFT_1387649 [Mycena alexandri]|uniref:Transmembrane protein n=1 Tax=Mycena alexandri TaxID=1745969 RepID=A0AAD6TLR9_9AGAR|nr:hypothetical protein C8F04DRAFT_1387649 [Mycena alexandri]